jgi:DNA-binding MurR/RpiR family transcriptional regulator
MASDIFTRIRSLYNTFTRAEKKVADYVLADPRSVLYVSITDLADACGVGDTSVFRFCRDLKLKGYQDFKMAIARCVAADDESDRRPVDGVHSDQDLTSETIVAVFNASLGALKESCDLIDPHLIQQAALWMKNAGKIQFFGVGASMITAMDGYARFLRIIPNVGFTQDVHLQTMLASLLDEKDLAILISYSGSTKDVVNIARLAKERGARTICITRFVKSPLTNYSDLTLLCGANEGPYQGGSISVKIAQLFLLDVLYSEFYRLTYEQSRNNKATTSRSVSDKLY